MWYSKHPSRQLIQRKCPAFILHDIMLNNCQEQVGKHPTDTSYIPDTMEGTLPTAPEEQIWSIQPISSCTACIHKPGRILRLWRCALLLMWGLYKRIKGIDVFEVLCFLLKRSYSVTRGREQELEWF